MTRAPNLTVPASVFHICLIFWGLVFTNFLELGLSLMPNFTSNNSLRAQCKASLLKDCFYRTRKEISDQSIQRCCWWQVLATITFHKVCMWLLFPLMLVQTLYSFVGCNDCQLHFKLCHVSLHKCRQNISKR